MRIDKRAWMIRLLATAFIGPTAVPALANWVGPYEVYGVQGDDMLKLRAGPGTGYVVLLGLPNGTPVRIMNCQLVGGTNWCRVFLDQAPAIKGFVSDGYLREKR